MLLDIGLQGEAFDAKYKKQTKKLYLASYT